MCGRVHISSVCPLILICHARAPMVMEAGWREFDTTSNVWDAFAGQKSFPLELCVGVDLRDLDGLTADLVQSRWRPSTRVLYQGWVRLWCALCRSAGSSALPCDPWLLAKFVTILAASRAGGTVAIACSAIIAFSAINDFANPFSASPVAGSAFKAAVKVRQGPRSPAKDGVDPVFIVRLWELFLPRASSLTFEEARMWAVIQLGWEAANRPGELRLLALCDLMRVSVVLCEPSADMLERVLRAKNDPKLRGQLTRLVGGGGPEVPNFVHLFDKVYEPLLSALGFVRHARCPSLLQPSVERLRTEPCTFCPPLFPTRPCVKSKSRKGVVVDDVVRPISTQKITEDVRQAAKLVGLSHLSLSGKSLRIGGFSAATEDGNEDQVGLAAAEMRWASTKVPLGTYKRRTVHEQQATGRALQSSLRAVVAQSSPLASSSMQPLAAPVRSPAPAAAPPTVTLPAPVPAFTPCAPVSQPLPPAMPRTPAAASPAPSSSSPCPLRWFPMAVEAVAGVAVCRRFQFGLCPLGTACHRLHVCHVCGVAHGLCPSAQARVAAWAAVHGLSQ